MRRISFIVTDSGAITVVANGKSHHVPIDHSHYKEIRESIVQDNVPLLEELVNPSKAIAAFAQTVPVSEGGLVTVKDGVVFYGTEALRNALTDRIVRLMKEGFPFAPFVKFLENLMLNPSKRSVDQLYNFLEHQGLPITEDGHFLAYKRVKDDWTDYHSGTLSYKIGSVVELVRNKVDDDPESACSTGLHAGALSYVANFNNGGHLIIVKINPKDCVSVPKDSNCTKLRTCRLEVIGEYTGELNQALYTSTGAPAIPSVTDSGVKTLSDNFDEDEDDEKYEDDEYDDEEEEDFDDEEGEDEDEDDGEEEEDDEHPSYHDHEEEDRGVSKPATPIIVTDDGTTPTPVEPPAAPPTPPESTQVRQANTPKPGGFFRRLFSDD